MSKKKDDRKFYIDWEAADQITKLNLKEAYAYMSSDNAAFENKLVTVGKLEEHEISDMSYNTIMMTHIREVLKYYGESV